MPLPLARGRRAVWPYAKNSDKDSVGEYRGILHPVLLTGDIHCWWLKEASEALLAFNKSIKPLILDHIDKHTDLIDESSSVLQIALYMVGKRAERTKPVVFFISDDKKARSQAFDMVKESRILDAYPGFELGETSSGSMRAIAREALRVFGQASTFEDGSPGIVRLFREQTGMEATAGGLITHCGRYMLLTANHFLQDSESSPNSIDEAPSSPAREGEEPDSCRITGFDDSDDPETESENVDFVYATSRGSQSESDGSISESGDGSATALLRSVSSTSGHSSAARLHVQSVNPTAVDPPGASPHGFPGHDLGTRQAESTHLTNPTLLGGTIVQCPELDYALIEIDPSCVSDIPESLLSEAISFKGGDGDFFAEPGPHQRTVWTITSHGRIDGVMLGSVHHIRLPHTKKFIEVYIANFSQPLVQGDCGSWVKDEMTGHLYGHVIAGNLTDGQTIVVPARPVFDHARSFTGGATRPPSSPHRTLRFQSALKDAVLSRRVPDVESLLEKGADPNLQLDSDGTTFVQFAVYHCNVDLLSLLIRFGARISNMNRQPHYSVLHLALFDEREQYGYLRPIFRESVVQTAKTDEKVLATIELLFKTPSSWDSFLAMVDRPGPGALTPLMMAAKQGLTNTTAYLLSRGADPGIRNLGLTAYRFAKERNRADIVAILDKARAKGMHVKAGKTSAGSQPNTIGPETKNHEKEVGYPPVDPSNGLKGN